MSLPFALQAVNWLAALSLFLGGLEFLLLSRKASFRNIWSDRNLKGDLQRGLPFPGKLTRFLFSGRLFPLWALGEMLAAAGLALAPSPAWVLLLIGFHLLICIRFRGTYNGGSDMMTFVVLTGLLISLSGSGENARKLGLIYISLHAGYSYLKAGLVKLAQRDWRRGKALPVFIDRSLLPRSRSFAVLLGKNPALSRLLSWFVILFEISVALLPWLPQGGFIYAGAALGFHLGNYFIFGLNRFFWIWLAAWPALLYGLSLFGGV